MIYGSVCSGIEAASVAWEPLGWQPAWFSEIEPFPSSVLAHHYPKIKNLGDMTRVAQMVRDGKVVAPDVLVGGTPCQAFSVAGLRGGLSDARGALTIAYVELADAIDYVRRARGEAECIAVWENVPGVLTSKDNAFGCFIGALAGEACELQPEPCPPPGKSSRYWRWQKPKDGQPGHHTPSWPDAGYVLGPSRAIAWRTLDAQYFNLAQRRERVFVVASARNGFDPAAVLFEFEGVRRDTPPRREATQDVASTIDASLGRRRGSGMNPNQITAKGGNRQGGALDVATACRAKGGTGHGDFESETFIVEHPPIVFSAKDSGARPTVDFTPPLRPMGHASSHANGGGQLAIAFVQNSRSEVRMVGGDGSIVGALAADHGVQQQNYVAQVVPALDASYGRLQGCSGQDANHGHGHLVVHGTQDPDICFDHAHPLGRNSGQENAVCDAMRVRRLMPIECERLQGFPDGHTAVPHRGKPAADGPRYKGIGNSMATNCMRWIGERIAQHVAKMIQCAQPKIE